MEFSYSAVKRMDVVNITDGKHLGKIYDMDFDFPENNIRGFYVTGGKGFRLTRQDIFLPLSAIIRVGEDVILTDLQQCVQQKDKRGKQHRQCAAQGELPSQNRRNYDEYE